MSVGFQQTTRQYTPEDRTLRYVCLNDDLEELLNIFTVSNLFH
jgi:hypothetical protein